MNAGNVISAFFKIIHALPSRSRLQFPMTRVSIPRDELLEKMDQSISNEKIADLWQHQSSLWVRTFLTLPVLFGVIIGAWWSTKDSSPLVGKAILLLGIVAHLTIYALLRRMTEYVNAFRSHLGEKLPSPKTDSLKGYQIARVVPLSLVLILVIMLVFAE